MSKEDKINKELLDTFQAADLIVKFDYLPDEHPTAIFWKETYLKILAGEPVEIKEIKTNKNK